MSFYYSEVNADVYERTISCHPFIESCNATIGYRLLCHLGMPLDGKTALDVGAGTGQVSRFLRGFPGLQVEACDIDPHAKAYFQSHPELKGIPFHLQDIVKSPLPKRYDVIVCRGVYHHIPKGVRPIFIKAMCDQADVVIIADEGIKEYLSPTERQHNCKKWYGYVINEAQRKGVFELAKLEMEFLKHEFLDTANDGGDFKESPAHLIDDARKVGLAPVSIDRLGDWDNLRGGFFIATFVQQ